MEKKRRVSDFLYEEESYQLRGACFRVYNTLGGGITEKIIERALVRELELSGFKVKKQEGSDYRLGFLVNFSPQRLTVKRFVHSPKNDPKSA